MAAKMMRDTRKRVTKPDPILAMTVLARGVKAGERNRSSS
jgi:hypothetical protein